MEMQKRSSDKISGISFSKGLELPMNMIIVIAIAVLVLAVVIAFFASNTFSGISNAQAQRIFTSGCTTYCHSTMYETFKAAYDASKNNPDFIKACVALGYMENGQTQFVNRCLEKCGNCNMDVNQNDLTSGLNNLDAMTARG